ncbi:MAG: MFS transporter [Bacteroidota bacterium]|nr:MFS transporter [Bacteroidota bacterium]
MLFKRSPFPSAFIRLCIGALLFFLSFNLIIPELPAMLRQLGGSEYLGWIIPAFAMSALFARPLSGWMTDQLGRKITMIVGCVFCIISGFVYPWIQGVLAFIVLRVFHGFSTGFTPTGFTSYTADIVPREYRGRAMGWQGVFNNAGTSLGYGLGALIALHFSRNAMFYSSSILALLALLVFSSLPETKKRPKNIRKPKLSLNEMVYLKAFQPGVIMWLVCIPLGSMLTVMPDYTEGLGFDNKGLYLTWYISFSLLFRLVSGKISDALGRPWSTAIGTGLQILSMFVLINRSTAYFFYISAILYGIGQGFNAPSLFAWTSDVASKENRGKSLSTLFITLELGIIFGGLGSGYLLTKINLGYSSVFTMNLIAFAVAFALSIYYIRSKQPIVNDI